MVRDTDLSGGWDSFLGEFRPLLFLAHSYSVTRRHGVIRSTVAPNANALQQTLDPDRQGATYLPVHLPACASDAYTRNGLTAYRAVIASF